MCGIAGILDRTGASPDAARAEVLARMTRSLAHRGPDDEGYHLEGPVALGHRRLSIIDLAGGHQPLANEDGTVRVIFNGEIYNYPDLTRDLEARGHRFVTRSDTECIVHAYEEWGPACVERFRGMFAFAVWDRRQQRLFLARDRLGKKPLYYARLGAAFIFGSEIKALLAFPGVDRTLDLEALSDYVTLRYVPAPRSIFRAIRKLPPGHVLLAGPGGIEIRRYWDVSFAPRPVPDAPAAALAGLLAEAVAIRLRSDVPLGAFLSGGLDSSAIVGLMARALPGPVVTASIGFTDDTVDELPYARGVAAHFGTDHHEHVVTPDAVAALQTLVWHYDEPFADASAVPTYYVSRLARTHVTVALSGDGGDENFAGYRRYAFDVRENRVRRAVPACVRRPLFGLLGAIYPKADYLPQVLRARTFLGNVAREPWEAYLHSVSAVGEADTRRLLAGDVRAALGGYRTADLFESLYRAADAPDPLGRIQYIDFKTYLPDDILVKVDRASMAVALEVRCPLLDHRVVEFAAGLPADLKLRGGEGKVVFREAVENLVPPEVLARPKMGFVVPLARWLRRELAPLVEDAVLGGARRHGLFDTARLQRLWREHRAGVRDRSAELWSVLVFNLWFDRFGGPAARE